MVSQDLIAQLRQDITTAEDADDRATASRLRAELDAAQEVDGEREEIAPDTTGTAPRLGAPAIEEPGGN